MKTIPKSTRARIIRIIPRFGTICSNLKNVKNTHGGVLILVKLQAKVKLLHRVFFTFFKLLQMVIDCSNAPPINIEAIVWYCNTSLSQVTHTCAITDKQESTVFDLFMSNTKFGFLIIFIQNRNGKLNKIVTWKSTLKLVIVYHVLALFFIVLVLFIIRDQTIKTLWDQPLTKF